MSTERELMLAGELYRPEDPKLVAARARAHDLVQRFNRSDEHKPSERSELLARLFGARPVNLCIVPPFFCDYGAHIAFGSDVFINAGCVVLDCARVVIGAQCKLGPNVQLLTATHPIEPEARLAGREFARPITIEDGCWLGGGVIVCPGVTIGAGTTIGAGSVVTRDVPPLVVAAGNPCRVLRTIG